MPQKELFMRRLALFSLFVLLFLLVACGPQATETPAVVDADPAPTVAPAPTDEPADTSVTIVDALGREVVLPAPPERIVFTGRALFMIADAAYTFPNAAEKIVGIGNTGQGSGNFIELIDLDYEQKAVLDRDAGAEQIAALNPDLVMMKSFLAESAGAPIEAIGIPVVYIDFETPEQYMRDLAILGKVFGDEARADEVAAFFQAKMDEVTAVVANAPKPRVLLLNYNDSDGVVAFRVPPLAWLQTSLVEMAGGEPVWADAGPGDGWSEVTLEQIAAWDADQIYVVSYFIDPDEVLASMKADPTWQAMRAVQEGNLYAFAGDVYLWDQPDPRWILGLTWLAGKIHPDLFPDLDIIAEMETFYQTLYGLDAAFVEQNMVPALQGDIP
jgi:iron complex transport system substrate-binding protein